MRKFILLLVGAVVAFANPAPFGFELGKATYNEVVAKYTPKQRGTNEYSQGKSIAIPKGDFELDGLQGDVVFTFDANDNLVAVVKTLHKNKFDDIFSSLQKYNLVSKDIPFVGNKSAKFKDGTCEIILDAPHLSFQMELIYVMGDFYKKVQNSANQKEQNRKSKQDSML